MKRIYTSLDIGSDTIKVVCMEQYKDELNLLASASVSTKGVQKGIIVDPDLAKVAIKSAFSEAEQMLGIKIQKVIVNIPSYRAEFTLIKGAIDIKKEANGGKGKITGNDILKSMQVAIQGKITKAYELVTIMPIDFSVDGSVVRVAKGLEANQLVSRSMLVTIPKKSLYDIINLVESLGIEVVDVTLTGIADLYCYLNKFMSNHLGAIIDIGAEKIEASIYNKGVIVKATTLDVGGKKLDDDLAYMYKVDAVEAKKIKEKFALAHKMYAQASDLYVTKNLYNEEIKINQFEASEVVMSRLEEMLNSTKQALMNMSNRNLEYIIITGGTSNMEHFNYIADDIFGKNVIIGSIKQLGLRDNRYAAALGSILYFISELELKDDNYSMLSVSDELNLSHTKVKSSDTSMLEKVFVNFFGE